jgi:hypothetical protein
MNPERYTTPLPQLTDEVAALATRVEGPARVCDHSRNASLDRPHP